MIGDVRVGTEIPEWVVESVEAEKMKTMALLLRDPNPIHWDVRAVESLGLGNRVINQGPTNKAYVVNALIEWVGDPRLLRSIAVRFKSNVHAGDRVVAGGVVTDIKEQNGEQLAECDVWLRGEDKSDVLTGKAVVALP